VLLTFLLYAGVRLGAALNLQRQDVRLAQSAAWVRHQKGQPACDVRLRADLCTAHLASHGNRRVFRFHQRGHLKHQLVRAKLGYLGIPCPARRHKGWHAPPHRLAWATWMRQAGTDVQGLVATGNWRDARSAARCAHAVARDEWARVELLPSVGKKRERARRKAQRTDPATDYTLSPPGSRPHFFGASLSRAGWILTAADPTGREA
jgi:hypothetical protein